MAQVVESLPGSASSSPSATKEEETTAQDNGRAHLSHAPSPNASFLMRSQCLLVTIAEGVLPFQKSLLHSAYI
jgi:hypothetical protein